MLRRSVPLLCAGFLGACALSIDAVIPYSEATFDPVLIGTWESSESDRAVIEQNGQVGYLIDYTDGDGKVGRFEARLGQLGERLVFEVWPVSPDLERSDLYKGMLLRGRVLLVLSMNADEVQAAVLDLDSIRSALVAGTLQLPYLEHDDNVILTGTTEQLRAELTQYLQRPGVLGEFGTWRRVRGN